MDKKCFLSHNVSPEKMPTCKFYLEGSCSREDCPYVHVRISPKADVCKDFLEGFCKKAAEVTLLHVLRFKRLLYLIEITVFKNLKCFKLFSV